MIVSANRTREFNVANRISQLSISNTLAVHTAKHYWQYYAAALQDQDVQYVKILPHSQVMLTCAEGFAL